MAGLKSSAPPTLIPLCCEVAQANFSRLNTILALAAEQMAMNPNRTERMQGRRYCSYSYKGKRLIHGAIRVEKFSAATIHNIV